MVSVNKQFSAFFLCAATIICLWYIISILSLDFRKDKVVVEAFVEQLSDNQNVQQLTLFGDKLLQIMSGKGLGGCG